MYVQIYFILDVLQIVELNKINNQILSIKPIVISTTKAKLAFN